MTELAGALDDLAGRTSDVTVVVLTAGVDGYFIAHADLDDLSALGRGEPVDGDPRAWRRALSTLEVHAAAHGGRHRRTSLGWRGVRRRWPARCGWAASGPTSASRRSLSGIIPGGRDATPPADRRAGRRCRAEPDRPGRAGRRSAPGRPPERGAPDRRLPRPRCPVVRSDREPPRRGGVRRQAGGRRRLRLPLHEGLRLEARLFRKVNAPAPRTPRYPGRCRAASGRAGLKSRKY
jgi:hypothetical protein